MSETRAEMIARWEREGWLDPACGTCRRWFYEQTDRFPSEVHAPRHKASDRCNSGRRPHCSCEEACF